MKRTLTLSFLFLCLGGHSQTTTYTTTYVSGRGKVLTADTSYLGTILLDTSLERQVKLTVLNALNKVAFQGSAIVYSKEVSPTTLDYYATMLFYGKSDTVVISKRFQPAAILVAVTVYKDFNSKAEQITFKGTHSNK